MGVYLTTKLNWRLHIENVINKYQKTTEFSENSTQSWCQDTKRYYIYLYL